MQYFLCNAQCEWGGGRFGQLQVWDGTKYIDVADMLSALPGLESEIEADKARLTALEDEGAALQD